MCIWYLEVMSSSLSIMVSLTLSDITDKLTQNIEIRSSNPFVVSFRHNNWINRICRNAAIGDGNKLGANSWSPIISRRNLIVNGKPHHDAVSKFKIWKIRHLRHLLSSLYLRLDFKCREVGDMLVFVRVSKKGVFPILFNDVFNVKHQTLTRL
jgi:hypothetical protein